MANNLETFRYDNQIVKLFAWATMIFGVIGMAVGVLVAFQLVFPSLNFGIPYTTLSRIRPVHTNAVIFAFVGNAIFMGVYHSMPRLLKTPMWSKALSYFHFWGWQAIIVSAAVTIPLGFTTSKEYAELEWPFDVAIVVVWGLFILNVVMTMLKRRERHLYVAIWFYIATAVTVWVLHIFNSFEIPYNWLRSYSLYAGVQDALVQWWYGHNAVAFVLTTPFLGLMYYYLPKAANRPVYSYRLSIIHFWSLIFIYIWAGPHHLLYSALPGWAQSLGTAFSIMLIAPSWGGMFNGLLTMRGAWYKFREDPIIKFMVVAVVCYGWATLEGPLLALKSVNSISHFTDWTISHVHVGTLGWNGMLTMGIMYWLIPRLWKTKLKWKWMASTHFYLAFVGMIIYVVPLWLAAVTQGLMWKAFNADGFLMYPNFIEITQRILPLLLMRGLGGALYLFGFVLMIVNLVATMKEGSFEKETEAQAAPLEKEVKGEKVFWHRWLEKRPVQFSILATIVIAIGGFVEIVPLYVIRSNVPTISSVTPYTPLELEGRDIYIREGCLACHSQQVRPFRDETERYGPYSMAGEYVYDHPFLWGSKRTGPDLHRVGGKYPDGWHYSHMEDPVSMTPGSIMPVYPWLITNQLNTNATAAKIRAMQTLGVPYPEGYDEMALADLQTQADSIAANLQESGYEVESDREIIALIAYLQRLGQDIKVTGP